MDLGFKQILLEKAWYMLGFPTRLLSKAEWGPGLKPLARLLYQERNEANIKLPSIAPLEHRRWNYFPPNCFDCCQ